MSWECVVEAIEISFSPLYFRFEVVRSFVDEEGEEGEEDEGVSLVT